MRDLARTLLTLATLLTLTNSFSLSRLLGISDKIADKSLSEVNTSQLSVSCDIEKLQLR